MGRFPDFTAVPFDAADVPSRLAQAPAWLTPSGPRERYPLLRWKAGR